MSDSVIYKTEDLIAQDIDAYLDLHQHKSMLRFITCGSVDDGKSTLIGRLLYDSKMIFEDQLESLEYDSKKVGTQGQHAGNVQPRSYAAIGDNWHTGTDSRPHFGQHRDSRRRRIELATPVI